ncbi:MAG: hypothetical protein WED09_04765, partial [Homoserinimonas sp.]
KECEEILSTDSAGTPGKHRAVEEKREHGRRRTPTDSTSGVGRDIWQSTMRRIAGGHRARGIRSPRRRRFGSRLTPTAFLTARIVAAWNPDWLLGRGQH